MYITPIHKKGARNLTCNYRPVSLTSIFSKLMESIIKDHILNYLSINNLLVPPSIWLYTRQIVLHTATSDIGLFNSSLRQWIFYRYDLYLDFQKAFDTVPHHCLLQTLTSFGIHGNVLKWFESFLLVTY